MTGVDRTGIGGNFPPPTSAILAEKYASIVATIEPVAELADDIPAKITLAEDAGKAADIVREARKIANELDEAREKELRPHLDGQRETNEWFGFGAKATKGPLLRLKHIIDAMQVRADEYAVIVRDEARKRAAEAAAAEFAAREEEDRQRRAADAATTAAEAATHAARAEVAAAQAAAAETIARADPPRAKSAGGATVSTEVQYDFDVTDFAAIDLNVLRPHIPQNEILRYVRAYINDAKKTGEPSLAGVRIIPRTTARIR